MSIWDDLSGTTRSNAANEAARDTYQKQQAATQGLNKFGKTLPGAYQALGAGYQPYAQAGQGALQQLLGGLGLGGDPQAFTQAYQSLPGYQSGLQTGTDAARRQLNAGNIGQSGAALKGLYRWGSDYEDQRSGDYLNRLSGLAGVGMQATGAQAGLGAQGLGAQTGLRQSAYGGQMQSAGTIGQGQVAGAQAEQSALQNLLGTAAYLGGSFLGGGMPKQMPFSSDETMTLNMHVRKGDNGWNGIFIPGDSALFGADNLESMAKYLEADTEHWVPIVAQWLRAQAVKLRAC